MRRDAVAKALGAHYSRRMNGTVWAFYDEQKRAYCIRGEALPVPADTQLAAILSGVEVVKTWSMLDYVKPQQARRLVGN